MKFFIHFVILASLLSCSAQHEKSVLLAILARNKAHTLPEYLKCIENLDYSKRAITIYINTNNNVDATEDILRSWAQNNEAKYKKIIFESHVSGDLIFDKTKPHEWNSTRFKVLAHIRNKSMQKALDHKCDFYFVADCDNFLTPATLKTLVEKNKPIIGPMLRPEPTTHPVGTFWCDVDENGYYKDSPLYYQILNRAIRGTFRVPLVHCSYLVRSDQISKLNYMDGSDRHEFIIFAQKARENQVDQYICNEIDFGVQYTEDDPLIDLEQESRYFDQKQEARL